MGSLEIEDRGKSESVFKKIKNFDFEEFIFRYRIPLILFLVGLISLGVGVFFAKDNLNLSESKVEVLESATESLDESSEMVVEIAGAVESPGVYKFLQGARIEDLLIAAGGVSANADRAWMEKFLNRAAKLSDGQKVYILRAGESQDKQSEVASAKNSGGYQNISSVQGSGGESLININTASASELESLWGIGPVYAQNIIEHRPYSSVEELLTRKIIKTNVYERNKDLLTVY